jgi:hypothetical protein
LYYGLLAGCLLLGLGLMVGAWQRPRTRQRGARILAGAGAAGALWLMAFPPLRHLPASRAAAILLTPGYSPDTLRQLLRQQGPGTTVWNYDAQNQPNNIRPLPSLLTLAEQQPALRRLHVLGQGLPVADLSLLNSIPVRLHADYAFRGFETAHWPAHLSLGETLPIEGTVAASATAGSGAWVVLWADGAGRDSVRLAAGNGSFRLRYQPKTAGLVQYELQLHRPSQPAITELVPVEITAPQLPNVLLLTATPSFEFKFLKNFLGEAHYPVALRTSISRGLVQTDFVNLPTHALDRLTPALLARYGVIVADAATLATLTPAETQALQAAVRAGHLGIVVLAEAVPLPRAAPARADFTVRARPAPTLPQALRWPNMQGAARAPLPASLIPMPELRVLVSGPQQAVAAASRRLGLGFAVVSVVPETFRWVLQGSQSVYASFWNRLLTAAVPPAPATALWRVGSRWPHPGQPLTLHLTGLLAETLPTAAPLAGGPAARLALRQDTRLPEWSSGQYWPTASGWHQVRGPGHTKSAFYVYPPTSWLGPERQERQLATASHNAAITKRDAAAELPVETTEPWPAAWFFGLFLLAAGYLWLEEKL